METEFNERKIDADLNKQGITITEVQAHREDTVLVEIQARSEGEPGVIALVHATLISTRDATRIKLALLNSSSKGTR